MVMLFHAGAASPIFAPGGYLAVDLFFVLSGFVLANAYEPRLRAGLGAVAFLRLRIARIYPMFALGMLVGLARLPAAPEQLLLIPRIDGDGLASRIVLYPSNVAMWSLFVELVVNGVFAAGLWRLSSRWLALIVAACGALVLAGIVRQGSGDFGAFWCTLPLGLARCGFGFGMGVLLCRRHRRTPVSAPGGLPAWNTPPAVLLALVALVLLAAPQRRDGWDAVVMLAVMPALVWLGVGSRPATPRLAWLGDLSYPLYCIHLPVIELLRGHALAQMVAALLLVPVALSLDRRVDRPLRRGWTGRPLQTRMGIST
ncbi:MAG: acyltransferase [Sphingomonadales bacterium]|nr:acyltransferase [Sphingomonadales bacterium]